MPLFAQLPLSGLIGVEEWLGDDEEDAEQRLNDLFERFERVAVLCIALVFTGSLPADLLFGQSLLVLVLWLLAVMTHLTTVQRFWRAWRALGVLDRDG